MQELIQARRKSSQVILSGCDFEIGIHQGPLDRIHDRLPAVPVGWRRLEIQFEEDEASGLMTVVFVDQKDCKEQG